MGQGIRRGCEFDAVLDRLYEVVTGGSWERALTALADVVGAEAADLTILEPANLVVQSWHSARLDLNVIQRYRADYMTGVITEVHPRVNVVAGMRSGELRADSDVWTREQRGRMPFFEEFYRPLVRVEDCLMAVAQRGAETPTETTPSIIVSPHFRKTPDATARAGLRHLLPHIRRVYAAQHRLGLSEQRAQQLRAALDGVGHAVLMADARGRVVHANAAAARVLKTQQAVCVSAEGRLTLDSTSARAALGAAIAAAATPSSGGPPRGRLSKSIAVEREGAPPVVLTVLPLAQALTGEARAVALIFVNDPLAGFGDVSAVLQDVHRLSPMETRLALAIAAGVSLKRFAVLQGLTYETVRSYVRRVLAKTGGHCQADIVRLVRGYAG